MKFMLTRSLILSLAFIYLFSCNEEHPCDTIDYSQPEIVILQPADGEIVIPLSWDAPTVSLHLKAEAGLNTLKVADPWGYGQPVHLFTDGETDVIYTFQFTNAYEGKNTFMLFDLCNQLTELEVNVSFEQGTAR